MKTKTVLFTLITLCLMGGVGCKEDSENYNNVAYSECDCKEKKQSDVNLTRKEATLFITSSEKEFIQITEVGNYNWIIYNIKTNHTRIYSVNGTMINIFRVCNFPDFAKKWNISDKGQKVYFEGKTFVSCEEWGSIATVAYFDYVLTTLIMK